jgi:hypothetical protein
MMFKSPNDNFQVLFRAEPTVQELGLVPNLTTKLFSETREANHCQVGRTRVATYYGTADDFLDNALDVFVRDIEKGALTSADYCEHSGLPALEFHFTAAAGFVGRGIMVLHGNTLFTVTAIGHASAASERDEFVSSFSFIECPAR